MSRAQELRHILSQNIIRASTIHAAVEMAVQHEVNGAETRELDSLDSIARFILGAQEVLDARNREQASKPGVFFVVAGPESDVGVRAFVAGARVDDPSDWALDRLAEAGYVDGVEGVVAPLLWWVGLCESGRWDGMGLFADVDGVF